MLTDDEIDRLARYWRGIAQSEFDAICSQAKEANMLRKAAPDLNTAAPQAMLPDGQYGPALIPTADAADAFWKYWNENGETHKHGYYESTWSAINRALRTSGVVWHHYQKRYPEKIADPQIEGTQEQTGMRSVAPSQDVQSSGRPAAAAAAPVSAPQSVGELIERLRDEAQLQWEWEPGGEVYTVIHAAMTALESLSTELSAAKAATHYAAGKMVREENDYLRAELSAVKTGRDTVSQMLDDVLQVATKEQAKAKTVEAELAAVKAERDEAPDTLAGKLIDAWVADKGRQIPWAKAIQIVAIVTKQSDEERDRLLYMGDENGSCEMCGRSDARAEAAEAALAQNVKMREALAELVRLKDFKDAFDKIADHRATPNDIVKFQQYRNDSIIAWSAARAAHSAQNSGEGKA